MTDTLDTYQPKNAAQALYLPWLKARIDSLATPRHGFVPTGTPPRKHKIADRAARKALARELGRQREAWLRSGGSLKTFQFAFEGP